MISKYKLVEGDVCIITDPDCNTHNMTCVYKLGRVWGINPYPTTRHITGDLLWVGDSKQEEFYELMKSAKFNDYC